MVCKICDCQMRFAHDGLILNKHKVTYWFCDTCEFYCTDKPHWLAEAYSKAISDADTGIVSRNLLLARQLAPVLRAVYGRRGRFVDWAGGWGMLVRLMRDAGFDFYWQDEYAENLMAPGHSWSAALGPATAVTAVEVFEHLEDPISFVRHVLTETGADTLYFTTVLHQGRPDPSWAYLTPSLGQHISFFSQRTLRVLGEQLGMKFYTAGNVHVLTSKTVSPSWISALVRSSRLTSPAVRRSMQSLTQSDHAKALIRLTEEREDVAE